MKKPRIKIEIRGLDLVVTEDNIKENYLAILEKYSPGTMYTMAEWENLRLQIERDIDIFIEKWELKGFEYFIKIDNRINMIEIEPIGNVNKLAIKGILSE